METIKNFLASVKAAIVANPKKTAIVVAAVVGVVVVLALGGSIRGCIDKM
jgi:hypothetical protein